MKNFIKSFIVIAIVALIGFLAACVPEPEPDDPIPETVTYSGISSGTTYTLTITENISGRYAAKDSDGYVLTLTETNGTKTSRGTVTVNGSTLTLAPSNSSTTFTVTVEGSSGISSISGTITFDDGKTESAPASIAPPAKSIKITEITGKTGEVEISVNSELNENGEVVSGKGTITNNSVTVELKDSKDSNWTGSGFYYIRLDFADKSEYMYSGGVKITGPENVPKYNITSTVTSIAFSEFTRAPDNP